MGGVPRNLAVNRFAGSSYTSWGRPVCWRTPSFMTAIWSEMLMASSWSCVTNTVVIFVARWILWISSRVFNRSLASRLERGSSRRRTRGIFTSARAMATLCCWPPESSPGLRSINSSIWTMRAASMTRFFISSFESLAAPFRFSRGKRMFFSTVRCG